MLSLNLTLLVQMVLFLAFAWLMNLVFFRPVTRILDERKEHIAKEQAKAEEALRQVQGLQSDYEARLKQAQGQAQDAIQAAVKEAEAKRQAMLAGVRAETEAQVAEAREAIRLERERALSSLQGEVGPLAEMLKSKALSGSPVGASGKGA